MKIFVSYRRSDTLGTTGRIYDRLVKEFHKNKIFIDVDTIPPGRDFIEEIEKAVSECDVLIVVIGRYWLVNPNGEKYFEDPGDFVRTEVRAALNRKIVVLPVLVENAQMPKQADLPDDLKLLTHRNAIEISHTRFRSDVDRLVTSLINFQRELKSKKIIWFKKLIKPEKLIALKKLNWIKIGTWAIAVLALSSIIYFGIGLLNRKSGKYPAKNDSVAIDTSKTARDPLKDTVQHPPPTNDSGATLSTSSKKDSLLATVNPKEPSASKIKNIPKKVIQDTGSGKKDTVVVKPTEKQYVVGYFEITSWEPRSQDLSLRNLDPQFRQLKLLRAADPASLKSLIEAKIISLLKTDAGSAQISGYMKQFWQNNTHSKILTFAPGTSISIIEKLDYEDALKKYSVGSDYDDRLCKIEINYTPIYKDLDLKWGPESITDVTLKLNFMAAVFSDIRQGTYSESQLISMKKNWTKFVVTNTEEK